MHDAVLANRGPERTREGFGDLALKQDHAAVGGGRDARSAELRNRKPLTSRRKAPATRVHHTDDAAIAQHRDIGRIPAIA
jgi:hypothetical protein